MKTRCFVLVLIVGIAVAATVTVILQRQMVGPTAPTNWQQRFWVSAAAERRPQPQNAKEWQYAVLEFEPTNDGRYKVGGLAIIIYEDKRLEQRKWHGVAEIEKQSASLTSFELGKVISTE